MISKIILICLIGFIFIPVQAVDLSDSESEIQKDFRSHYYNRQWFQKIDISGTLGVAYSKTGSAGSRPYGSFNNKQAIIWIDAEVWKDVSVFIEWFPLQMYFSNSTGSIYINLKNFWRGSERSLNFKIGRFDMPFGEEYLQQNWIDNPLIARSAAWPWGWDGGIMAYGHFNKFGWIATYTDGKFVQNGDSDIDYPGGDSIAAKIYTKNSDTIYASLSYLLADRHTTSAFWIGNNHFVRGGTAANGAGTNSTNGSAKFDAAEAALKLSIHKLNLLINYGLVNIVDTLDASFNRQLAYYMLQPVYDLDDRYYIAGRFSSIMSDREGYVLGNQKIDGNYANMNGTTAKGNVKEYQLLSIGAGYKPNPNMRVVIEYTIPNFTMADSTDPSNSLRHAWGMKWAAKF